MALPGGRVVLLLVFIDMLGVGMAMPLVSPLIKQLGATPFEMGLLSSVYGAVQLLSSPFMGLLSDRYGRKLVILIGYGGSMAGYALLSGSTSVRLVVASRIITGLLKHSQNAMRALVVDHTTRANRSVQLGRLATMSGLGIMVGPTLGGFLYKMGGSSLPMLLASLLYVANCLIVAAYLPQDAPAASATKRHAPLLPNLAILGRGRVAALFAVRVVMGLAVQTFRQGFAIQTLYRFNLGVRENGFLISYQGALSSLVQGVAMKPLTRRYDDHTLLRRGMMVVALSFAAASLTPNLLLLVLLLAPVALTSGVLRTTYASVLTASVPSDEVGQILGLSDAVMSACRVVSPTLAGALGQWFGYTAPGVASGVLMIVATALFSAVCVKGGSKEEALASPGDGEETRDRDA